MHACRQAGLLLSGYCNSHRATASAAPALWDSCNRVGFGVPGAGTRLPLHLPLQACHACKACSYLFTATATMQLHLLCAMVDLLFVVFSTLRTALTLHARTPCSYVASAIRWQSKVAADGGHLTTLLLSALPNLDQSLYFPQDKFDPAGVHALKCMFKSAGCFITDNNGVGF
jgi:hypothetical protein